MVQFKQWLIHNKGLSDRSSNDVISRLKRVCKILNRSEISSDTVSALNQSSNFKALSTSVKSQLRRSIKLYEEYLSEK